jgi:pyrroloquinoline quinone (PQQ) biosynthesis protein C
MADDLSNRGAQDRARVNVNETHELRNWTKALGVDEARLRAAVAAAGTSADAVRKYLGK